MSGQMGIGKVSVCGILKQLGLKKVCAKWVPKMLINAHKETGKTVRGALAQYESGGDAFLARIVTGDETCCTILNQKHSGNQWNDNMRTRPRKRNSDLRLRQGKL
jgi:hypothetical protein